MKLNSLKLIAVQNCFFLYYFRYTSRSYEEQESLLKDLNRSVPYQKTTDFFIKSKGLHSYFERNGGKLGIAITNANRPMDEKLAGDREYTYSEIGRLIRKIEALSYIRKQDSDTIYI